MGLRMDDLHNPTVVPSGPSTSSSAPNDAKDTRSLLELMDYKTKLEGELSALGSVLDSVSLLPIQPSMHPFLDARLSSRFPPSITLRKSWGKIFPFTLFLSL